MAVKNINQTVIILLMVAVCYSTANSIAKEADATISGFKYAVASSSAGNADDITAEPQNYRPYNDRRTNVYNTGYLYNRRPFFPNNKRSLPDFKSPASTTPSPTSTSPSPASTNSSPASTNTPSLTSTTQSPTSTTQSPVHTTELRTSCYATNGTFEELGICWDKKNRIISYNDWRISPHTFGLFYKYKEEEDADSEPIYVKLACYIATQFLDNQIVMCAAKHNCYNKEGKAFYTYCSNNVCTCIIDERYKPNVPSKSNTDLLK